MVQIISFVKTGDCPSGWTEDTTYVDRIPAFDVVANAGTTGGSSSSPGHGHSLPLTATRTGTSSNQPAWTSISPAGAVPLDPPYVKVRFCKKEFTGDYFPTSSMVMFSGTCPDGWTYISTYNNRHPRGASSSLGTTGQTSMSHYHTVGYGGGYEFESGTVNTNVASNGQATSSDDFISSATLFSYVKVVLCKKN